MWQHIALGLLVYIMTMFIKKNHQRVRFLSYTHTHTHTRLEGNIHESLSANLNVCRNLSDIFILTLHNIALRSKIWIYIILENALRKFKNASNLQVWYDVVNLYNFRICGLRYGLRLTTLHTEAQSGVTNLALFYLDLGRRVHVP